MLNFLKIATSLRMFITLFIFLSNSVSYININLQRNRHQCFDQKNKKIKNNTNFDTGAHLSMIGVKNEQNCLLRYCLLRYRLLCWMFHIYIKAYISVIQC